ncbi:MAG: hypothetical protein LAP21_17055 [Acidobacteriia bacterium]|nr:hypothetical protein [Terriglobia bacterium]
MTFKTGDRVLISFQGKTVSGEIFMASDSGLSLTLLFDGNLGVYERLMPVLWIEESYVDLMGALPVTIASATSSPEESQAWRQRNSQNGTPGNR